MIEIDRAAARAFILPHEGLGQPWNWPGGNSGVTIGWGYDLAHHTKEEFWRAWSPHLQVAELLRLAKAIGRTGIDAAAQAPMFRSIHIKRAAADDVFDRVSLPKYQAQALKAFPGMDQLPSPAQVALVSLVYNRGPALEGERRLEMKGIHKILADGVQGGDLAAIAAQIRGMKRLWEGRGLDGLLTRREAEAQLVEGCIPNTEGGNHAEHG